MTQAYGITPDTKDWTWVLGRPCPECGFVAATMDPLAVGAAVRASLPRWRAALTRPDIHERPAPGTWSPLEYSGHIRDVFRLFDHRLELILTQQDPVFEDWDQDVAAVEGRYADQDPDALGAELTAAGERIAASFDAVAPEQLQRTGQRSDGAVFTAAGLGMYLLHEVVHHLH
ncbi:MAG: DinB family protein, partial [Propionibacteriaceae bacterium]|nr:DinB family protein [Propionibacteriaceae bacterium]